MQILINGLISRSTIALLALAFQTVYLPTRVFFIALGGGLPEVLRFLDLPDAQAANLRMLIYGLLLVIMMHVRPQGIAGDYRMQ